MGNGSEGRARFSARRLHWPVVISLILFAIVVPYLLFGAQLEATAQNALQLVASKPWLTVVLVVLLLALDVVLPVPSSVVGAFAGAMLGIAYGTLAVWSGLMLGCVVGYWLGRAIAASASANATRAASDAAPGPAFENAGLLMLAVTRSIPVLAETGIIAAGAGKMSFGLVLLVTALANLLVALAYVGAGAVLVSFDPALAAIGATVLLSGAWGLWLLARRRRAGRHSRHGGTTIVGSAAGSRS